MDIDPDVRIERDGDDVRQVLHLARPYTDASAGSPEELATLYLHVHAELFGIDPSSLSPVAGMPPMPFWTVLWRLLRPVPLLRWLLSPLLPGAARLDRRPTLVTLRDGESFALIFRQVQRLDFGWWSSDIRVWGAGIRLMVALSPLRLTAAYSTLRHDRRLIVRSPRFPVTAREAARKLDIPLETVEGLFFYGPPPATGPRALGLGPVLVYGRLEDPEPGVPQEGRRLPYRVYQDLLSGAVVRREVLASNAVSGLVFHVDPCSQTARPRPGPSRPAAELDARRARRRLRDLVPPLAAPQDLRGSRVYVAADNPLGIPPPTRPVGANFDYTSRSNYFAAVSAYYHCDAAFRMVEALGFPLAEYFAANVAAGQFPIRVVHRAPIRPGPAVFDGRTVNAQVVRAPAPSVVGEMRFALGDWSDAWATSGPRAGNPVGIAADARFAWHELGHVLLIASTGELEFRFAHSAGDALAAIICDLDSSVAELAPGWRDVTFPWVQTLRRHGRAVNDGWGWHGTLYDRATYGDMRDPAGYRAEQLLSSTLFRLYQALGGNAVRASGSPDLTARRAAAAYAVYLVVRAIRALGPATTTPALDAYALAGALMEADVATSSLSPDEDVFPPFESRPRRGGAVHKVVRWAFERQGLYAPAAGSRPWNDPGEPEAVDVYVKNGRNGAYDYTAQWHAQAPDLRVAALPNPNAPDAPPHWNTLAYVFVRVVNRGIQPNPPAATVKVFVAREIFGPPRWRLSGPDNPWKELVPGAGAVVTAVVPPGGTVDFGPFEWKPRIPVRHGLLACVDAPGDRCNALSSTLACAVGPTPLGHLVPLDNNLAYREVVVHL